MCADRLRVGVVGTGLIAQVMHLPYLAELDDLFEIRAVCDASRKAAEACAARYGATSVYTDWRYLVEEDLDAVLVLTSGSHAPIAGAAAESGRSVFVEKPLCYSVAEGKELINTVRRTGVTVMVGYPKRYDPAFIELCHRVSAMGDLRFVQLTTMESPVAPYVGHYRINSRDDIGQDQIADWQTDRANRVKSAIGDVGDLYSRTYEVVLIDSLVHELNLLRGVLGEPDELKFASIREASVNVLLDFNGVECALTWIDLPGIARYEMEVRFYDPNERLRLAFPSPFLRSVPTVLDSEKGEVGTPHASVAREIFSYEEPFKLELVAFHRAVTEGAEAPTSGIDGLHDIALCQSIIKGGIESRPVLQPSDLNAASTE